MSSDVEEVRSILVALIPQMKACKILDAQEVDALKSILRHKLFVKNCQVVLDVFDALDAATAEGATRASFFVGSKRRVSNSEQKYAGMAAKAFEGSPHVKVSFNEQLFGFEADIVLRVSASLSGPAATAADPAAAVTGDGSDAVVVNVEIDGSHHTQPVSQLFCHWRDRYLTERRGVVVKRIDLMSANERGLSDADIIKRFREMNFC